MQLCNVQNRLKGTRFHEVKKGCFPYILIKDGIASLCAHHIINSYMLCIENTSVWVSIDNPCNVRLTGKTISALFCDNSEMTEDTMTAIMCVLNEFDETLDSFSNHQHWRTFLPALSLVSN